jgi:thymidylate kinase
MIHKVSKTHAPIRVSFSGIDGAGKSTQIELLCARLSALGARVRVITFWDNVAVLTRFREVAGHALFKGEKGVGAPDRPVNRRDKNVRYWHMTGLRLGLYFLEAIKLRLVATRTRDADVVIFDRYLYDQLANLPLQQFVTRMYARLLLKLVPKPDIAYLIDADPERARERKPEYPIEFLSMIRAAYLRLSQIEDMTVIAPGAVEDVAEVVMQKFLRKFPGALSPILDAEASGTGHSFASAESRQ